MVIMTGHVICHLVVTFDKNRWVWERLFCNAGLKPQPTSQPHNLYQAFSHDFVKQVFG